MKPTRRKRAKPVAAYRVRETLHLALTAVTEAVADVERALDGVRVADELGAGLPAEGVLRLRAVLAGAVAGLRAHGEELGETIGEVASDDDEDDDEDEEKLP
jgi:hypothetical protein